MRWKGPTVRLVAILQLLVLHALREVNGDYIVSVFISSYSNPSHRHYSGGCCDAFALFGTCLGDCDNYFIVCEGQGSEEECQRTGEVGDRDTINFGSRVGRLSNPINFTVQGSWNGELTVTVDVYDNDDYSDDEFIGWFRVTEPTNGLVTLSGRQASMTLSVTVTCSEGYFGADCSVECEPDPYSHWCDPNDGHWVCVDGWSGEWCDVCTPYSDCSDTGGYCETPGECICREGYTGPLCSIPPSAATPGLPTTDSTANSRPIPTDSDTSPTPPPGAPTSNSPEPPTNGPPASRAPSGPTDNSSSSTGTTTPTNTASILLIPSGISKPQPFLKPNSGRSVIGGVVGGLLVLIVLLVVLILMVWCCVYQQRRRRKQRADDVHPLVQPLIGENPMYVDHAMGTHSAQQNGQEYHQFTNPLYRLVRSTQQRASSSARPPSPSSSPLYAYPEWRGHLLASVYLPGDDSPLTGSLSSQQPCIASSPSSGQHYEEQHQPASASNAELTDDRGEDVLTFSHEVQGHRTMSISDQYFHLPPDIEL